MRASKSKSDLKNTSSGGIYAYNQLWAIYHGQLTTLLRTWEMLFEDEHHLVLSYLTANTDVYHVFDM